VGVQDVGWDRAGTEPAGEYIVACRSIARQQPQNEPQYNSCC
jgi:hypothetical protein